MGDHWGFADYCEGRVMQLLGPRNCVSSQHMRLPLLSQRLFRDRDRTAVPPPVPLTLDGLGGVRSSAAFLGKRDPPIAVRVGDHPKVDRKYPET